jgi:para-nitrobenzyl esterase
MHQAWSEFISSGSPGWQPYDTENRNTLIIGEHWGLAADPYADVRAAWT